MGKSSTWHFLSIKHLKYRATIYVLFWKNIFPQLTFWTLISLEWVPNTWTTVVQYCWALKHCIISQCQGVINKTLSFSDTFIRGSLIFLLVLRCLSPMSCRLSSIFWWFSSILASSIFCCLSFMSIHLAYNFIGLPCLDCHSFWK